MTWTVPVFSLGRAEHPSVRGSLCLGLAFGEEWRPCTRAGSVAGGRGALVLVEVVEGAAFGVDEDLPELTDARRRDDSGRRFGIRLGSGGRVAAPALAAVRTSGAVRVVAAARDRHRQDGEQRECAGGLAHVDSSLSLISIAAVGDSTRPTKVRSPARTTTARVRDRSSAELSTASESSPHR